MFKPNSAYMTYGTGILFGIFFNLMSLLPSVGISIFVEDLLMPSPSSLCLVSRSSFVKSYR